jgi:hypothetical protein
MLPWATSRAAHPSQKVEPLGGGALGGRLCNSLGYSYLYESGSAHWSDQDVAGSSMYSFHKSK